MVIESKDKNGNKMSYWLLTSYSEQVSFFQNQQQIVKHQAGERVLKNMISK